MTPTGAMQGLDTASSMLMTIPESSNVSDPRVMKAVARAQTLADRFRTGAIGAAAYGLLAVVGSITQGHRAGDLAGVLHPASTVAWLVWWAVTAVVAAAVWAACMVGASVLGQLAANMSVTTPPAPDAGGVDHYQ
jgi:hypothetical protein